MFEFDESALIACCALRFDGPSYLQDHPQFQHKKALERYFATGRWPDAAAERFTLFFLLQLCSAEPKNSKFWHAYRELFLQLHSAEIPHGYKREDYWLNWKQKYSQVLHHAVRFVREIHDQTEYLDQPPEVSALPLVKTKADGEEVKRPSWFERLFRN